MFNYIVQRRQVFVATTQVNSTIKHFFIMSANVNSQPYLLISQARAFQLLVSKNPK